MKTAENVTKTVAILLLVSIPSFGNVCVANKKFKVNQVCGYVRDKDGVAVPDASVSLNKAGGQKSLQEVKTDQGGDFQFSDIPSGEYEVTIKYPAFADAWQPITVNRRHKSGKCRKPLSAHMEFIGGCSTIGKSRKSHAQTH